MKLANLSIGKRLALGFGAVSLMLVLISALSNASILRLNNGTREIVEQRIPAIEMSNRVEAQISIIAIAVRNMMLNDDPADRQRQVQAIEDARKVMTTTLVEIEPTLMAHAESIGILRRMETASASYLAGADQLVKLIQAGEDAQARAYLLNELRPRLGILKEATGAELALQKQFSAAAAQDAATTYGSTIRQTWGLGLFALALAAGIALWITRSITRPVARALEVANTVAAGDLTSRIEVTTRDETGQLLQALKTMNDSLARTVGAVRAGTDTIAVAAEQVAAGSLDLSSRTEQQAGALEETASSMEELTSTVRQNADNARQANKLAESASGVAARGGEVIHQVVGTMDEIQASSSKIGDIIGVIDGIAFQTNILALNAAVEAARAGEQGRGFAVVATEVRNLAQRSAAAAREIKELIGDSSDKVANGSRLVAQAGATMEEIVDSVRRVTDIMAEISAASLEQTAGIEQINGAVAQMDEGTQQNAALVEETAAASNAMQEQAARLAQAVAVFRIAAGPAVEAPRPVVRAPASRRPAVAGPAAAPAF
ncbi:MULTISPECIES: methyl-accepting chemotaxis protein [Massilia]|uniref:methyl-accepting chemotaxis protein n=1 Tax=Massilia TaxID=149698 RepID=UPI001616E9B4|nr:MULTISPECIES: methyl-accepting chemotaxis protein [Massilia]QYG01540.1 MCP four helix bundle domain-containing protein [Massilia sp. NP310]